ncbi:hypothetical protein DMENIID0001_168250 [Sergentomyia squamirostris]
MDFVLVTLLIGGWWSVGSGSNMQDFTVNIEDILSDSLMPTALLIQQDAQEQKEDVKNGYRVSFQDNNLLLKNIMKNSYRGENSDQFNKLCNVLFGDVAEPPSKKARTELIQRGGGSSTSAADIVTESGQNNDEDISEPSQHLNEDKIEILEKEKNFNNFYKMTQLLMNFRIKKPQNDTDIDWLKEGFDRLIEIIKSEAKNDEDKILMQIYLEENSTNRPIYIFLRNINTLTTDVIFTSLEKVHQSTSAFSSTDVMGVRAFLLQSGEGRGRTHHNPDLMTGDDFRQYKRRSIIDLDLDTNCLPNSLIFDINVSFVKSSIIIHMSVQKCADIVVQVLHVRPLQI